MMLPGLMALLTLAASGANWQSSDVDNYIQRFLMPTKACQNTPLQRSRCMIELMLDDIGQTYERRFLEGIARIEAMSPTSYTLSIPSEGEFTVYVYEFAVATDVVTMTNRRVTVRRTK